MEGPDTITASRTNGARREGHLERADRNMVELLQELRVAQTGVQILFAFLRSLVFQHRFAEITQAQRWIYVVTLLLSVATAGLLVAPAAVHRVTFRRGHPKCGYLDKKHLQLRNENKAKTCAVLAFWYIYEEGAGMSIIIIVLKLSFEMNRR